MFQLTNAHLAPEARPYKFVTIIGNVGAGKSTLTRALSDCLGFDASFESVANNPYLDDFYRDQAKWGFHLQIYFLAQRYKSIVDIGKLGRDHIQDRSIYEDVEIFAQSLVESGKMPERDFHTYKALFWDMAESLIRPDLAIYLHGDLQTILGRIALRGRESERNVSPDYWAQLHRRYQAFIGEYTQSPVLWVNVDQFDIIKHPEHLDLLAFEVRKALGLTDARAAG